MPTYRVTWKIDLEADSEREAAERALEIQRDPDSIAIVFSVRQRGTVKEPVEIDLCEEQPE